MKPSYCKRGERSPKKKDTSFSNVSPNNFFVKLWFVWCCGLVKVIEAIKGSRKIEITWKEDKDGNKTRSIIYED